MNINAEELDKALAVLPGLFKFNEEEPFSQAILAISEEALFVYNDHAPDQVSGDTFTYRVKVKIPLNSIDTIVEEQIIKQPELAGLDRLGILLRGETNTIYFYYFNEDKKSIKSFLSYLKRLKVSSVSRKVKLSA